jgi:hypothetical protein
VLEPDGKVRTVDYEVDGPKGFHAVIRTQFPSKCSDLKSRECRQKTSAYSTVSLHFAGYEVLVTMVINSSVFWDVKLWGQLEVNRRFGEPHCLKLQSRRKPCYLIQAGFLIGLSFDPEDRINILSRNLC